MSATAPLCIKLTTLATNTNNPAGVTRLANTSLSNASLDSVVSEMNLWQHDSFRIAFLLDIADVSSPQHIGSNLSALTVRMTRGWKIIYDSISSTTIFKKDFQVLKALDTILWSPAKFAAFSRPNKNLGSFLRRYAKLRCTICGGQGLSGVPRLDSVLMNTVKVFEVYQNVPGFSTFYDREVFASDLPEQNDDGSITINPSIGQDGAQHQLKYMVDSLLVFRADTIDGRIWPGSSKSDLMFLNGRRDSVRFIEFKSYKITTALGSPKNAAQMSCYLAAITRMKELRYVFNDKKTTLAQARTKMQDFFKSGTNATTFLDVIWENDNLRISLFGLIAKNATNKSLSLTLFNSWVTNMNDNLFSIVKVN